MFIFLLCERIKNYNYIFIIATLLLIINFVGNFKYNVFFASLVIYAYFLDAKTSYFYSSIYSKLGNLTYGSYLLHIPIQLFTILIFYKFELDAVIFTNYYFLIIYLLAIFYISHISYKFYENPIRIVLKNNFNKT